MGMRGKWRYLKRRLRGARPFFSLAAVAAAVFLAFLAVQTARGPILWQAEQWYEAHGVQAAGALITNFLPALSGRGGKEKRGLGERVASQSPLLSYLEAMEEEPCSEKDPAFEKLLAERAAGKSGNNREEEGENGLESSGTASRPADDGHPESELSQEAIAIKPGGQTYIMEKLADFDYLMSHFYSVHSTTTAGRDLIDAQRFLSMDLSLKKEPELPQILFNHTHSHETFADYPENPEATIVGVGEYLAELLRAQGYQVIHDTTVYDYLDGQLDRNQAYTYALDGITGILQENPSIEVVLDVHRDGVSGGTRLVKEINGKPTAQIMFFNGTSQTPEGPIEYLPNPNRDGNLAFSLQMQLKAADQFPGFTRKIYLKGLRYNLHVRARSALIEVGAQTSTYEEARNAMEPLCALVTEVLEGD